MVLSPTRTPPGGSERSPSKRAVLDVVVPVYNEAAQLARSVRRLRSYLDEEFPFPATLTIVDNGSSDATPEIAASLGRDLEGVRVIHLSQKGRGRALRVAWSTTQADVVCYTDVDLSTSLEALLPLVAPLLSGHSDLAIGSRLAPGAHVVRGAKRELISRAYNLLLRSTLRNGFTDAQCGFKAVRADVARRLLPLVDDDSWFFDTELLVVAERSGLRIHEVAVDWVDDPDSQVRIVRTATDDLLGVLRLLLQRRRAVSTGGQHRSRFLESTRRFAEVGVTSTLAYAALFFWLRLPLGTYAANTLALALCTIGNAAVHHRLASSDDRRAAGGILLGILAAFVPGVALTTIGLLLAGFAGGGDLGIAIALFAATAAAAVVRFAAFSSLAFHNRPDSETEVADQ
jgi:glycosyltransferase involved in cell wall biosynthesis